MNNLYTSSSASYCIRAGKKANIRVENNVFIGVKNPLDYNNQSTEEAKVTMIGNYFEKISGNTAGQGSAFTPSYSMPVTDVSTASNAYVLRDSIQSYAGPTLAAPGTNEEFSNSSSSVVSSSASSSSSVTTNGSASLTKHGAGSSSQTVAQGNSIVEFYYTIVNATGATVAGLPEGVTSELRGSDLYITGTVSATASVGKYEYTILTTGAATNATKTGTFTITAANMETESSSSLNESSSSMTVSMANARINYTKMKLSSAVISSTATLHFTSSHSGFVKVTFLNAVGSVVQSQMVTAVAGENAVNIVRGNLPTGTYYLNVRGTGLNLSQRVNVQ